MALKRVSMLVLLSLGLVACQIGGPIARSAQDEPDYTDVPEAALRAAAREIERQVHEGVRDPVLENRDNLVVDTPEIRQAIRTRAARIDLVNRFLNSGHGWERRNGRLWVLRSDAYKQATTGRQRDLDAIMVNGENQDRWTLYEGLIEANDWPQRTLAAIEQIFFEERLNYMLPGQKYEDENGEVAYIE